MRVIGKSLRLAVLVVLALAGPAAGGAEGALRIAWIGPLSGPLAKRADKLARHGLDTSALDSVKVKPNVRTFGGLPSVEHAERCGLGSTWPLAGGTGF